MNRKFDPLIKYEQKNDKQGLYIVTIGHLLLALLLLMPNPDGWTTNFHAQICLFHTLIFLVMTYHYNWENPLVNSTLGFVYIFTVIAEFSLVGIPGTEFMMYFNAHRLKVPTETSILIDSLLFTIPIIYFAIRICLVLPISSIIKRNILKHSIRKK